uniref:Uncharacterized protein n=1 Tax=Timema poppense TaxID=170557 RepID=A0A7R9CU97_TIMPO|nr:unnamed protein product [Timema poppensis]
MNQDLHYGTLKSQNMLINVSKPRHGTDGEKKEVQEKHGYYNKKILKITSDLRNAVQLIRQ